MSSKGASAGVGTRPCDRLGEMVEARLEYALEMVELDDESGEVIDASVLVSD